uniref:Ribonuclease S-5-like n=1 Tax=Nicotiana tabacum TaxID=4097 RepID=A0A1S4DAY0_TOBAC|nr:PREDICTED: ribonuclease S-5-like [Nicotiana tabacum]
MQLLSRKTPCKSGIPKQFFIHGLWPCDTRATTLTCPCAPILDDQNVKNVLKNDNNLETVLHNVWPNLIAGRQDKTFWKYQWRTHGLCSSPTMQVTDYFKAAATVHATMIVKTPKQNLIDYFVATGINPDGPFTHCMP